MNKNPPCHKSVCGPCAICKRGGNFKYFHLCTIKSASLIEFIKSENPHVSQESCICRACRSRACRKVKYSAYTPEKTRKIDRSHCFLSHFLMCDLVADVNTCCTLDDFNDTFSLQCESIPNSISLCKKHRTQVSNFHMTKNTSRCFICKSVRRSEDRIYCSTVLSETAVIRLKEIDTAFSVSNDVHLCAGCYRYSMRSISKIPTLDELEDEIIKQNQSIGEIQTPKDACDKALVSTLQILLMICRK